MNSNTSKISADLLSHVTTIGRDFDTFGGDIPMAIALTLHVESAKPKGYRRMASVYFSKIVSAKNATERLCNVVAAAKTLHEELGADWLEMALATHYGDAGNEEAASERAVAAMSEAARNLSDTKDDPWLAVKVLGSMIAHQLTGKMRPGRLVA